MLSLNPPLLSLMDTPHLISALEAEGPLTSAEKELCARLAILSDQEAPEEVESRLEKAHESAMEQSYFRAQLIEEILALCDQPGTKRDLVAAIKSAVENSYVEL